MKTTATLLLLLLMSGAVLHMVHYYPLLPATVASHFGISGEPDGWTSKQSLVAVYALMVAVLGGTFLAVAIFVPRLPASWINLPNRDYWLGPERRRQSLAAVTATLLWMGCATVVFIIAVMQLTFQVNLGQRPGLGSVFFWLLGIYFFGLVGTTLWMMTRFRKPPEAAG